MPWPYFWIAAMVVFAVAEGLTFSLVTIWFALGAAAALIICLAGLSILSQCLVFTVVSALTLLLTRPLLKKLMLGKFSPTNADRNIGRHACVVEAITPDTAGRVQLDGVNWRAVSEQSLNPGDLCTVVSMESTTLTVTPVPTHETASTH